MRTALLRTCTALTLAAGIGAGISAPAMAQGDDTPATGRIAIGDRIASPAIAAGARVASLFDKPLILPPWADTSAQHSLTPFESYGAESYLAALEDARRRMANWQEATGLTCVEKFQEVQWMGLGRAYDIMIFAECMQHAAPATTGGSAHPPAGASSTAAGDSVNG